ncbi:MAG: sulfatase [Verrucomicrobiota bacterium]
MKSLVLAVPFLLCAISIWASERPNILFIMSDDHASQAIGAYGGILAQLDPTPTIDRLAEEGVLMENVFAQNSICTPSRASIMTGQSSAVNGATDLDKEISVEQQYLSKEMRKAGYQTAVIGKWHLKEKPETFDYYKVLVGQGHYIDPVFLEKGATGTVVRPSASAWERNKFGPNIIFENAVQMEGHSTDRVTDSALEWLREERDPKKPFFLKLHYKAPHDRFRNAPRYDTYLDDVDIPEPDSLFDRQNHGSIATRGYEEELLPFLGSSISMRHRVRNYRGFAKGLLKINPEASEEEIAAYAYQQYLKRYLRCVKGIDDNIQRVLNFLKEEGLDGNTVVVYTSDQGMFLGEHDYIDKRWAYEESMRMPFIVRYPESIPAGSRSDAIVENIDIPAMLLDYAGVETPDYMHGRSFRTIMETGREGEDWKDAAYYHYWMHLKHHFVPAHIGIRTKEYKLLLFYGCAENSAEAHSPPAWELYDLIDDPKEMNNLYDDPEYSAIVEELKERLKELRSLYGEDDPKFLCNRAIDAYWDYDDEDRSRAVSLSESFREEMEEKYPPRSFSK